MYVKGNSELTNKSIDWTVPYGMENEQSETKTYTEVEDDVKRLKGRKHEDDKYEAKRLVIRAIIAHNSRNLVSPPFASFYVSTSGMTIVSIVRTSSCSVH